MINLGYLRKLKKEGHRLLDIYISLEHKEWRKVGNLARKHAYNKLGYKLGEDSPNHFRFMETEQEVLKAIFTLRKMIKMRKKKIAWLNRSMDDYMRSYAKRKELSTVAQLQ